MSHIHHELGEPPCPQCVERLREFDDRLWAMLGSLVKALPTLVRHAPDLAEEVRSIVRAEIDAP